MSELKKMRRKFKLTQKDLAFYLGCGIAFVSQIETGYRPIPADKRQKLCRLFYVSEDVFMKKEA